MKHLRLIPQGTSFRFVDKRNFAFAGSALAVVVSAFRKSVV